MLAYVPGQDPADALEISEDAARDVEALFTAACFREKTATWESIQLKRCVAISEDELTVSQAKALKQWRLDYLSLRADEGTSHAMPFG